LSTPQPKVFFLLRPIVFLVGLGPGVLFLLAASIYLFFYIQKLFTDPNGLLPLMCIGLYLGLVLLLFMMLPKGLRKFLSGIVKFIFRKKNKEGSKKH
jgi:hypothetical protein